MPRELLQIKKEVINYQVENWSLEINRPFIGKKKIQNISEISEKMLNLTHMKKMQIKTTLKLDVWMAGEQGWEGEFPLCSHRTFQIWNQASVFSI